MGNESSSSTMIENTNIDENPVESTNFWSIHRATFLNQTEMIVFRQIESQKNIPPSMCTPLEQNTKYLKVYRHPNILKYLFSWKLNSVLYLAVEDVVPLKHVLTSQSSIQICIGLRAILNAIHFLHNIGHVSHNNINLSAIYIPIKQNNSNDVWRLGDLQYLCKLSQLNPTYLEQIKTYQNQKTLINNSTCLETHKNTIIDTYAYCILVQDIFETRSVFDNIELEFLEKCHEISDSITNDKCLMDLSDLLEHTYFQQDFIKIYTFLQELPLKLPHEKDAFFTDLSGKLMELPEEGVAQHLGQLLLARLVLINQVAQTALLPIVLQPRNDDQSENKNENCGLFHISTFKRWLVPVLLDVFRVRDIQIRLLLLKYFNKYMNTFTKDQLQTVILPELLVGIKDTNDNLVAHTLRTLADLVPILGANLVIGGQRAKLFMDGRPSMDIVGTNRQCTGHSLPERSRPDGEEEEIEDLAQNTNYHQQIIDDNSADWIEWDDTEEESNIRNGSNENLNQSEASNNPNGEIDYFSGMEPVIVATPKCDVKHEIFSGKLTLNSNQNDCHLVPQEGWSDEDWTS